MFTSHNPIVIIAILHSNANKALQQRLPRNSLGIVSGIRIEANATATARMWKTAHAGLRQHELDAGCCVVVASDLRHDRSDLFVSGQGESAGLERHTLIAVRTRPSMIATRKFIVFWLATGCVIAGMNVHSWDVADAIETLVRSGRNIDIDTTLTNPAVSLDQL